MRGLVGNFQNACNGSHRPEGFGFRAGYLDRIDEMLCGFAGTDRS